jgi:hypothetical protein
MSVVSMRRVLLGAWLLTAAVADAALFDLAVSDNEAEGIDRMAVVSVLGDTFHGIFVGTTAFGNSEFDAEVSHWGIDALVTDHVLAAMTERGQFPAEPLDLGDVSRASLYAGPDDAYLPREAVSRLMELARKQGVDALLIVQRSRSDNSPFHKPGYGLYKKTTFGLVRQCAYALFDVGVYRTGDGARIAFRYAVPCETGRDTTPVKASFEQYSAEEQADLERSVKLEVLGQMDMILAKLKVLKARSGSASATERR